MRMGPQVEGVASGLLSPARALLRLTGVSCLVVVVAALLAGSGAGPRAAAHALGSPSTDLTAPVVAVATLLAWLCIAWLALICLLAGAATAPGAIGRVAARSARICTPWAVRRLLAGTLGLSTLLAAPTAALADSTPVPARPAPATLDLGVDWPGLGRLGSAPAPTAGVAGPQAPAPPGPAPAVRAPVPASPTTPASSTTPATPALPAPAAAPPSGPVADPPSPARTGPAAPGGAGATAVVVQPGDSLWTVTARALGPSATPRAVAAAWPAWWEANREVLGPDPGLIHPGDRLVPPAQDEADHPKANHSNAADPHAAR